MHVGPCSASRLHCNRRGERARICSQEHPGRAVLNVENVSQAARAKPCGTPSLHCIYDVYLYTYNIGDLHFKCR